MEFGVKDTKNIDSNKEKTTKCVLNFVVYTFFRFAYFKTAIFIG